jgi:hypothetical protein
MIKALITNLAILVTVALEGSLSFVVIQRDINPNTVAKKNIMDQNILIKRTPAS